MKMKMRRLVVLLLITMFVVSAIGCSSNTGPAPSAEKAVSQEPAADDNAKKGELFTDISWLKENGKNVVILDAQDGWG